jgi:hypothetical protein
MRATTFIAAAAIALTLPAGVALAHHGWSSYDAERTLRPTTEVVESTWGSPHGSLVIEQEGERWDVVLAPVSRMEARGLVRDDIAVGKTVTVVGYPRKDGTNEIRAERIIVGDKTVELR